MNNQILLGLVTIGLVASVVGVGTYAYFSDTETSTGNTMTAGKLDLQVSTDGGTTWTDGAGPLVTIRDIKPSYEGLVSAPISLKVIDNPAKLYKKITNIQCNQGNPAQTEPEAAEEARMTSTCPVLGITPAFSGVCNIDDYTWFDLTVDDYKCVLMDPDGTSDYVFGNLENQWIYLGQVTGPTDVMTVIQSFHLDKAVTNWAQSDQCTFDEEFWALQINDPTVVTPAIDCTLPR
jgi:predicted ribosomally synthesized peptide with SipW-like signal peptide